VPQLPSVGKMAGTGPGGAGGTEDLEAAREGGGAQPLRFWRERPGRVLRGRVRLVAGAP